MCGLLRRYDGVLWGLLLPGVKLTRKLPAAMVEHVSVRTAADAAGCNERGQAFLSKPHAGTETVDLLMCAASAGNASAVDALLQAGDFPLQSMPSHRGPFPSFMGHLPLIGFSALKFLFLAKGGSQTAEEMLLLVQV